MKIRKIKNTPKILLIKIISIVFLLLMFMIYSCQPIDGNDNRNTDDYQEISNAQYVVKLMDCNGEVINEWKSSGRVNYVGNIFYFRDFNTNKKITLTGIVIITEL